MSRREKVFVISSMVVFCVAAVWLMKNPEENTAKNGHRIAAVMPDVTNSFWKGVWNGVYEETAERGMNLSEYKYATGRDTQELNKKLETAFFSKPEGILVCANQYTALQTRGLLEKIRRAGTPLVLCDTDTDASLRDAYVGVDNEKAGRDCAEYLLEKDKISKAVIIKTGDEQISGATGQREQAFLERIARAEDSDEKDRENAAGAGREPLATEKLVLSGDGNNNYRVLEEKLLSLEAGTALICFNSSTTVLVAQTVERLARAEQTMVMGFSETEEALAYAQEGVIDALFTQDNGELGRKSAEVLEALIKGEEIQDSVIYIDMIPVIGGKEIR